MRDLHRDNEVTLDGRRAVRQSRLRKPPPSLLGPESRNVSGWAGPCSRFREDGR
jgi:hypothetical protein